jgi:hypothetical protein
MFHSQPQLILVFSGSDDLRCWINLYEFICNSTLLMSYFFLLGTFSNPFYSQCL